MRNKPFVFLLLALITAGICVVPAAAGQTGTASWYGGKFHGRKTANGEIFDTGKLTAAHRTLPFNTKVKVTNLANGRSVIVRINDRGPFIQGRIIDLSQAAAEQLDMIKSGTAPVRIDVLSGGPSPGPEPVPRGSSGAAPETATPQPGGDAPTGVIIQVGSFAVADNAKRLHTHLRNRGFTPEFETVPPSITRVIIRNVSEHDLSTAVAKLRASGINDFLIRKPK